jgi:hypothetical protein
MKKPCSAYTTGYRRCFFPRVTRWKEDEHVAIHGVTFEISLERCPVNLDAFRGNWLGACYHRWWYFGQTWAASGALSTTATSAKTCTSLIGMTVTS